MSTKPTFNTNPVANKYADSAERIVEYSGGTADHSTGFRPGGLISLSVADDGTLVVHLYGHDQKVRVTVSEPSETR